MNREIKLRIWDRYLSKMVYLGDLDELIKDVYFDGQSGEEYFLKGVTSVDGFEWMQYTGVKDKEGKEIYNGDIVRYESKKTFEKGYDIEFWEVRYSKENNNWGGFIGDKEQTVFGIHIYGRNGSRQTISVAGNIFETPELTKELK